MRKLLYFLTFLLFFQLTVSAQKVRGGLRGGIAVSTYHGVGDRVRTRNGPVLGMLWNVSQGKHFSIQPAFNFWVQKGYNQTRTILNSTTTIVTLKNNSMDGQVNFVYNTAWKKGNFFIGAGPAAGLSINGKWTYRTETTSNQLDVSYGKTSKDDFQKTEFGVNGTAGYYTSWGFLFSLNYYRGLTDLNPKSSGSVIQNSYFGINVGFLLPFEPKK
jgi:hypothetical protein